MPAALSVAFTPTPVPANTKYIVECGPQISAGIRFVPRSYYRVLGAVAAAAASPYDALAGYTAKFGALVSGSKIFFRFTPVDLTTWQKGTPIETSIVVT